MSFPPQLREYFQFREHLYTIDGVILYKDRIIIPPSTDLTASESRENTADMMILFSMPVTSDSESEVCMPDKNDVASLVYQNFAMSFPPQLREYFQFREHLYTIDGVILYRDRIIIPPSLREEILSALHAANQGVTSMISDIVSFLMAAMSSERNNFFRVPSWVT
jgi:nitrate reductase beta subunit